MAARYFGVLLALVFADLLAAPASAVTFDWVLVGDADNAPDSPANCFSANCGSVPYDYYISKYEVTNAQYAEFLNAKASSDPLGLYNTRMGSDTYYNGIFGGITRSGVSGSYTYAVKAGYESKPVTLVSFYDALRFSNWLHNGQGNGDTETGAYALLGGTATPSNETTVTRDAGAKVFLTSESEWYKPAYYSAGGVYFDYPAGTNSVTSCVLPGSDTGNSANCNHVLDALTDVGAYGLSGNPHGTFDQGGSVWEWNEQLTTGLDGGGVFYFARGMKGGSWDHGATQLASLLRITNTPSNEEGNIGFRVASVVPWALDDSDDDGVLDMVDNCPLVSNDQQEDTDGNRIGDACNDGEDTDGDEWADALDDCPNVANADQADSDGNRIGDACNDGEDTDGDEWADSLDNCPTSWTPDQAEDDGDGIGDACDPNPSDPTNAGAVQDLAIAQTTIGQLQTDLAQCQSDLATCQSPATDCSDGIDNDSDGAVDYPTDTNCDSPADNNEGAPSLPPWGCGLGPELAALLPLLYGARRARRRLHGDGVA